MKFRNAIFYPQEINDQTEFFFFYIIMRAALIFLEILISYIEHRKNFKISLIIKSASLLSPLLKNR